MMEGTGGREGGEPSAVMESPGDLPKGIAGTGEPDLLTQARESAWKVYKGQSLPPRSQHLWRYSDPEAFVLGDDLLQNPAERVGEAKAPRGSWECSQCAARVVLGGETGACVVADESLTREGVLIMGMAEAARSHGDLLRSALGKVIPPEHGKFEALAGAIWQSGAFLYVPKGVEVQRPIHLLHAHDESRPWGAFRYVVILGEGARATLVEEHVGHGIDSPSEPTHLFGLGEFHVGSQAKLHHVIVQNLPENARAHITYRTRLGHGADSAPFMVALGGKHTKIDYGTILGSDGCRTELSGVLFGAGGQIFDHHTVHDHGARHTYSNLEMRTVLTDRAMSAYTGLIRITTEAPYSEAYQENRNLVLSKRAKAESIPELEISTDEVQCKHGATVGSVDDGQIFYLMSRGIPRREATRIIVRGFVDAILDKAPTDLKVRLGEAVAERLEHIA
jgi:Fe-S cluster assembly protein SufD